MHSQEKRGKILFSMDFRFCNNFYVVHLYIIFRVNAILMPYCICQSKLRIGRFLCLLRRISRHLDNWYFISLVSSAFLFLFLTQCSFAYIYFPCFFFFSLIHVVFFTLIGNWPRLGTCMHSWFSKATGLIWRYQKGYSKFWYTC